MNFFLILMLFCDIKGEVKNPGIYSINNNTNINDIVIKAGGLTNLAETGKINLSKKVVDEMVIYIPAKKDYFECKCNCQTKVIYRECEYPTMSSTTSSTTVIPTTEAVPLTSKMSYILIDINTATIDQLISLKGIGKATATKIIDYRELTKFNSIEDIMNVSGIGEAIFAQIKDFITV